MQASLPDWWDISLSKCRIDSWRSLPRTTVPPNWSRPEAKTGSVLYGICGIARANRENNDASLKRIWSVSRPPSTPAFLDLDLWTRTCGLYPRGASKKGDVLDWNSGLSSYGACNTRRCSGLDLLIVPALSLKNKEVFWIDHMGGSRVEP